MGCALRLVGWLLLIVAATPLHAQLDIAELTFEPKFERFQQPVDITNAGDGSHRLFVLEQRGRIQQVNTGGDSATSFLDISDRVSCCGERGLLGLAFHPEFADNGYFFVNYTRLGGDTIVSRFSISETGVADPASEKIMLAIAQPFRNHNGGSTKFGLDGLLYIATGDGGSGGDPGNRAQDVSSRLGKILRINVDEGDPYAIPPDNPFAAGGPQGARPEIWAYGLRNPWRIAFDRVDGDLFIGDVGQGAVEEISLAPVDSAGLNFGWRRMEGNRCFNPTSGCANQSFTAPILTYPQLDQRCGGSVTGGFRYRGSAHPSLDGIYFYADFCFGDLFAAAKVGNSWAEVGRRPTSFSISTFGEDESGEIYFADYPTGQIYRIEAPREAPRLLNNGVLNAASFSSAPVAPGTMVSVFGQFLAADAGVATAVPLPTTLAGTTLTMNTGLAVPKVFAGPGQINGVIPWEAAGMQAATMAVDVDGHAGNSIEISLAAVSPGIFSINQNGQGQGAIVISGTRSLAAPRGTNFGSRPVRHGEAIEIFCVGLGPVNNMPATGAAAVDASSTTVENIRVFIGGIEVEPLFSGLTPNFVGLYQVNVVIPDSVNSGDAVTIELEIAGVRSNTVTIAIE